VLNLLTFRNILYAALLALAIGPLAQALAHRFKLEDVPNRELHKQHSSVVPVAGGIILVITVYAIAFGLQLWDSQLVRALLVSSTVLFLFGLWDDIRGLSPLVKMIGQILGSVVLVLMGVQVLIFSQSWLNIAITLLWLVGITNAYNFVDSMDGLAVGLGAQAAAFFMLATAEAGQGDLSTLSTLVLGACVGCYYYNALPARFFMGDSGSQFLGFLLAGLAIAYNPPGFEQAASWYVPILLMAVPIFDVTLVVFSRLRHNRPIYRASRDHTYHRLVNMGMSSNRAVLSMHLVAMLLGCLAFVALGLPPLVANVIFFCILFSGVAGLIFLEFNKKAL
jgi:UDP-GlcNAc:undecaprenyl-phosphate/decaprenyl-phosphate GlcNAc-1-phosphate transferase